MDQTQPVLSPHPPAARIPRPEDAQLDVYGLTHPGKVRAENQDHFLLCQLNKQIQIHFTSLDGLGAISAEPERMAFLAMVADGVASTARGEEASRLAVAAVTRYVSGCIDLYYASAHGTGSAFPRELEAAATRCHEDLRRLTEQDPHGRAGATTLTLFIGVWPYVYLVQVGDSRYYMLKGGELVQISRDQTVAQDLVDQGVFSRDQAAGTPWAHRLSSAIGGNEAKPVVTRIENDLSYVHLLCSDGLTRHVSDDRIAQRLREMTSARQVCEALLQDALDGGGTDNITILVGRARTD